MKYFLILLISLISVCGVKGQSAEESNAAWMAGEYGVFYQLFGGSRLDWSISNNYDYVAGAEEIVEKLPSTGYVITSFTNGAHGYYFTLRENTKMDVASIHPDFVPSLENEQVILDVIDVFRNAGKKVLLYIATDGPGARAGTPDNAEYTAAWDAFVDSDYNGDEALAYRDLCQGFIERFAPVVDGYWLDHIGGMAGEPEDFVAMIKDIDSTAAIALNQGHSYYEYEDGSSVLCPAVEGFRVERDFRITRHVASSSLNDFTGGHPTPLGQGAPPNHWSVEEFTHCDMIDEPWDTYDGKEILKHSFVPMQDFWTPPTATLQFTDPDQAYRWVRRHIDNGLALTWAISNSFGMMSEDEMAILEEVDSRLEMNPMPDFIPYSRPEGESLVGDDFICEALSNPNDCSSIFIRHRTEVYGDQTTSDLIVTMTLEDSIIVKPQVSEDGNVSVGDGVWTWEGPNSFNFTGRIFSLEPVMSDDFGIYTATYQTDLCTVEAQIELVLDNISSVGDDNSYNKLSPSFYPNPVVSTTTIEGATNSTITIYDLKGSTVFTKIISNESEIIDLSALAIGVYHALVISGSDKSLIKIIKN